MMKTHPADDGINTEQGNIKPCMACFAPNDEDATVCSECGAPFGGDGSLVPLGIARSEGQMWQKLATGPSGVKRPTVVILIGVWVIFLPLLATGIAVAVDQIYDRNGFFSFLFFWLGAGITLISLNFLYRVTKGYFRAASPDAASLDDPSDSL